MIFLDISHAWLMIRVQSGQAAAGIALLILAASRPEGRTSWTVSLLPTYLFFLPLTVSRPIDNVKTCCDAACLRAWFSRFSFCTSWITEPKPAALLLLYRYSTTVNDVTLCWHWWRNDPHPRQMTCQKLDISNNWRSKTCSDDAGRIKLCIWRNPPPSDCK